MALAPIFPDVLEPVAIDAAGLGAVELRKEFDGRHHFIRADLMRNDWREVAALCP